MADDKSYQSFFNNGYGRIVGSFLHLFGAAGICNFRNAV